MCTVAYAVWLRKGSASASRCMPVRGLCDGGVCKRGDAARRADLYELPR